VPVGVKMLFGSFALLLLPFVIYALRPSQTRPVGSRWWRGGTSDPVRRLLFKENGLPRRYSWALAVGWFSLWLAVLWLLPNDNS